MTTYSPNRWSETAGSPRLFESTQELVDAIAGAIDINRIDEVRRVQDALEPFGLDEAFADEVRLSGVPSTTWQRCEFCGDVIDRFEASGEAA